MEIKVINKKLFDTEAEICVVPVFGDKKDQFEVGTMGSDGLEKTIKNIFEKGVIAFDRGKKSVHAFSYKGAIKKIIFIGLGSVKDINAEKIREAAGDILNYMKNSDAKSFAMASWEKGGEIDKAQIEGVLLADYSYDEYKTDKKPKILKEFIFVKNNKNFNNEINEIKTIMGNVFFARDMMNAPGNKATPSYLAKTAKQIAAGHKDLKLKIMELEDIKNLGMGAFYGVAKGSDEPAKFIILEYRGGLKTQKPIALVGKGITFDSGGISIKPSNKMEGMQYDMSGTAITLAVIKSLAELKIKVNVVGLMPATENLPSGKAYKPGDILKSLAGKTIEVISTDAEGRLILADAITYSLRYKPAAIIDIATLTGAVVEALGHYTIGMMGNSERLMKTMEEAGKETGERVWQLPLFDEYMHQIKSKVADIKNTGGGGAGTITAGMFLKEFAGNTPWIHLDIAGTAYGVKEKPYIPEGASGIGVRLLIQFFKKFLKEV